MKTTSRLRLGHTFAVFAAAVLASSAASSQAAQSFQVTFLVSDLTNVAAHTDTNLLNPWGFVFTGGAIVVADNHSDMATTYGPGGTPLPFSFSVVSSPTGLELNPSDHDFKIGAGKHQKPARLLFATESGTILGYNPDVDAAEALVVVDDSADDAIFKGLALAESHGHEFIYATDFHNGLVKVYDHDFNFVGSFTDPNVDDGFAPFNIQNFGGLLYVTFAKQGPGAEDDAAGPGNGFVDIFRPDGHLVKRLISHGNLDSPWGMTIAPFGFGGLGGALLVGNFGDGSINAYNPITGKFLGQLMDDQNNPIVIPGLWGLRFRPVINEDGDQDGNHQGEDWTVSRALYFTAGPNGEADGLLGVIKPSGH